MGGDGSPPALNDEGKISIYGLLDTLAKRRSDSYNWNKNLAAKNDTALLKEISTINALNLRVSVEMLQYLDYIAMVLARGNAENIRRTYDPQLNALRQNAIGEVQ